MVKKSLSIIILFFCLGLVMMGCPKKTVVKEEPSAKKEDVAAAAEKERAAKVEAERAAKENEKKTKKEAGRKEFEKSLVAKRTPGIEGEVFESNLLKDIRFDFDKYNIRPADTAILKDNAALLKKYPNVNLIVA